MSVLSLEQVLERGEILPIGSLHGRRHDRRGEACKAGWRSAVTEGHMRPLIGKVAPRIGCFHRKRTFRRGHDQPLVRMKIGHFIGIRKCATQEACDEGEAGPDGEWLFGLPADAINVCVPLRSMIRIGSVVGYHVTWSGDVDGSRDVDWFHEFTKIFC